MTGNQPPSDQQPDPEPTEAQHAAHRRRLLERVREAIALEKAAKAAAQPQSPKPVFRSIQGGKD